MATLLDLIQEWAALSEAKTLAGGTLPESDEARWNQLREFYEHLMAQDGLSAQPAARYSAGEIRQTVETRSRLRVRSDLEIVVMTSSEVHLLLSDSEFGIGSGVMLHLANVSRGAEVLPTEGTIVWLADSGKSNGTFRYRMGVQFAGLGPKEERSLDQYVVDSLETKLLSLSRDALDEEFVLREKLKL